MVHFHEEENRGNNDDNNNTINNDNNSESMNVVETTSMNSSSTLINTTTSAITTSAMPFIDEELEQARQIIPSSIKLNRKDYILLSCILSILSLLGATAFLPSKYILFPIPLRTFWNRFIIPNQSYLKISFFSLIGLLLLS
ncbi:hypothetical protein ABK040_005801 [Willaertia magna]